jgi:hypothetical protein
LKKDKNIYKILVSKGNIMTDNQKDPDYSPIIISIPEAADPFKFEADPLFDPIVEYPKSSLGFNHFMHQSRGKLIVLKQFEGKKKVYLVLNNFERHIDDYKDDLDNQTSKFFDIKDGGTIDSSFLKMIEIMSYFDIVNTDKPNFVSAHIAGNSFLEAIMLYRDTFGKKGVSKGDKYHLVQLKQKEKKKRDDSALLKDKRVGTGKADKVNLVTADGGFQWENDIIQEQEAYRLILEEIITALKMTAKGGSFVCRFFECFTEVSLQLIAILTHFYDNVYICKPLTSRLSVAERYIVCISYKDQKDAGKKIAVLEEVLDAAIKSRDKHMRFIFKNYTENGAFRSTLTYANLQISNRQFMRVNEIVDFVEKQNFRGDVYQLRREQQIAATKYWVDKFYPTPSEFDKKKKDIYNQTLALIKDNQDSIDRLSKKIH